MLLYCNSLFACALFNATTRLIAKYTTCVDCSYSAYGTIGVCSTVGRLFSVEYNFREFRVFLVQSQN